MVAGIAERRIQRWALLPSARIAAAAARADRRAERFTQLAVEELAQPGYDERVRHAASRSMQAWDAVYDALRAAYVLAEKREIAEAARAEERAHRVRFLARVVVMRDSADAIDLCWQELHALVPGLAELGERDGNAAIALINQLSQEANYGR